MAEAQGSVHLPAIKQRFSLASAEPLSVGLQRVTESQFDATIDGLTTSADVDAAVHAARKSMKRLRATLRLVRSEIGTTAYRAENALLRDTARLLAPIRDGAVMATTVGRLRADFSSQLSPTAMERLEEILWTRHEQLRARALADPQLFPMVIGNLRAARARFASWPVEAIGSSMPDPYGRTPIVDAFTSVSPGLRRTYGRGRCEMDLAAREPTGHNFHWWRKRVKYLRHQIELLEPLWPEMMTTYAGTLDALGELLGDEHDLTVLNELIASEPGLRTDPAETGLTLALAEHRRRQLQEAALMLGRRIYAESPSAFVSRIGTYWNLRP